MLAPRGCDFCHHKTEWLEQALVYDIQSGATQRHPGDWTSCQVCHALIELEDRDGLIARSLQVFFGDNVVVGDQIKRGRWGYSVEFLAAGIRKRQAVFWETRDGQSIFIGRHRLL